MTNPFASKKKEQVNPIGGAMGGFDEEFEQGLETPKGPQILGSIAFNLPDFAPAVSEVVDSFYGLKKDIFGIAQTPTEQPSQAENETIFVRDRARALQEEMQRLTVAKQEDLMRDALRMSGDKVTIIDVVTAITPNTNPIQAQREAARMRELGISDVVGVVEKVETRDEQVADAEKDQSMQAAARTSAIANAAEGGSGQVGNSNQVGSNTGALANLSTTGGGAG